MRSLFRLFRFIAVPVITLSLFACGGGGGGNGGGGVSPAGTGTVTLAGRRRNETCLYLSRLSGFHRPASKGPVTTFRAVGNAHRMVKMQRFIA